MKPNVKVSYSGSGVKLTKNLSNVFIVISLLFLIAGIVFIAISDGYELFISLAVTSFIMFLIGLAISAALQALSSIAKTSLYQRLVLEQEYEFHNDSTEVNDEEVNVEELKEKDANLRQMYHQHL